MDKYQFISALDIFCYVCWRILTSVFYMKKITLSFLLLFFTFYSQAQDVSFTNQNSLLDVGPIGHSCVVDMNNDYLDDVVRVDAEADKLYIDFQQNNGTFIQTIYEFDIQNDPNWSIAAGDINADGKNDLVLGNASRVSFIISNSNGFGYTEDYHDEYIFSQGSTFADIDNDGDLDSFVCHDVDQNHPYRNDGSGVMTLDQTLIETLDLAGNYSAIWVDYDNDRDIDLFITKCRQGSTSGDPERTNAMYKNNGDGTFTEVANELGLANNAQSWSTTFQDFDNDGDMDAFVVNHDFTNSFMRNDVNTSGVFTEIIDDTAIDKDDLGAWEVAGADFNNDGYVDILSELSKELYLNNGDMTFTGYDLAFDEGGIGDLNGDGFLDVLYHSTDLYINDGNNDNNWVKLNLKGTQSNINGIGARVEVETDSYTQIRDVRAGESFSPMSSINAHFGLGTDSQINRITVYWPSGIVDTLTNPDINTSIFLEEGDTVGINDLIYADLIVYPIPAKNTLNLSTSLDLNQHIISVFTVNGKRVLNHQYQSNQIDISNLSKGIYILRIEKSGKIFTQKFLKE